MGKKHNIRIAEFQLEIIKRALKYANEKNPAIFSGIDVTDGLEGPATESLCLADMLNDLEDDVLNELCSSN